MSKDEAVQVGHCPGHWKVIEERQVAVLADCDGQHRCRLTGHHGVSNIALGVVVTIAAVACFSPGSLPLDFATESTLTFSEVWMMVASPLCTLGNSL